VKNNSFCYPIIIIGMHRSGTSMITRMLENLGLFVGKRKEENHEALFFKRINNWLLKQSGGAWDYPDPIRKLLNNADVRAVVVNYILHAMQTPRVASYLGWDKYIHYHTPANLNIPWGWKDPRNTYTLPIWLDIFPKSKIIHICRNGIDVANSLKVRANKMLAQLKTHYQRRKWLYCMLPEIVGFSHSLSCVDLSDGFSLWTDYLKEARTHVKSLDAHAMEIKYEDFLTKPYKTLKQLSYFCDLNATDEDIERVGAQVKKERAYAYRHKPELQAFAKQMSEQLRVFDY
jgi:hypothetical protein